MAPELHQKTVFKTAIMNGELKLIHDLVTDGFELYDLAADPAEMRVVDVSDRRWELLERELSRWEAARPRRSPAKRSVPVPAVAAGLRSLGYLAP